MKTFTIPDRWETRIKDWQERHECCYRDGENRRGGSLGDIESYTFTPTSVGMLLTVQCACGEEIRLSDI